MIQNTIPSPNVEELPTEYSDRLGVAYTLTVTTEHKKRLGQFFTPIPIANFMATYCSKYKGAIRILDPGFGTGILSCALLEHLINQGNDIKNIDLVVYEVDIALIPYSDTLLIYLKDWLKKRNVKLQYVLHNRDFVVDSAEILRGNTHQELFDIIITNPPYFKLTKDNRTVLVTKELVSGQPNIYSVFIGIAAKLLSNKGELIFISPRSFASGSYFKAFRVWLFNAVHINCIHLFKSRKATFYRDNVLQENVIIKTTQGQLNPNKKVTISSSSGINDISQRRLRYCVASKLVDPSAQDKTLFIPTSDKEELIIDLVSTWQNVLADFNIHISTGPVVSFRAHNFIQNNYENGTVFLAPLIWLNNVSKMLLEWPKQIKGKGQFIRIEDASKQLLIPNKNYVFLRRFSTKDDNSRLIAAPYVKNSITSDFLGIENKVNYIYKKNGELDSNEILGLCSLLNSDLFDTYFRIFNGNVNVSASELRIMKFPSLDIIKEIGKEVSKTNDFSMFNVNRIVSDFFVLSNVLN